MLPGLLESIYNLRIVIIIIIIILGLTVARVLEWFDLKRRCC
jgi:hypothetical protein